MIKLLYANVTPLNDDALFGKYYENASELRQKKIDELRFRNDKNLVLGSAVLLDKMLQEFGTDEKSIKYGYGPNGKPYFPYIPSLQFSLSHSGDYAAVAFSGDAVGCDIEKISEAKPDIAQKYFCKEEYEEIMASADKNDAFFRFWTLKESYMKATGAGFGIAMNSFCITVTDGKVCLTRSASKGEYGFFEFSDICGYRMSCCYAGSHLMPVPLEIEL